LQEFQSHKICYNENSQTTLVPMTTWSGSNMKAT
jgi:hypothetical protein